MLSGKFVLRLDPKLHLKLQKEAESLGISLNQLCINRLGSDEKLRELQKFAQPIRDAFARDNILALILYGSAARGQSQAGSDVDILVVFDQGFQPTRQHYSLWDSTVAKQMPAHYNPSFVAFDPNSSHSGLWLEVALDGIMIWCKDTTVKNHLIRLRTSIAEGRFVRKLIHGQPYWQTKEGS